MPRRLGDVLAGAARALHGRPDLGLVALDVSNRDRRLHRDMGKVRQVIFPDDHLVGALQGGVDVAFLAHDEPRVAHGVLELGAIGNGVVSGIGAVIPDHLQCVAALDRRTRVSRDHGHAAERLELGRPRPSLDLHDLFDAGHLHGVGAVEGLELAAGHGGTGDHRVLHAGQADVGAVMRGTRGDVVEVDDADLALAEIAEVLGVLQLQAIDAWHRTPWRRRQRDRRIRSCGRSRRAPPRGWPPSPRSAGTPQRSAAAASSMVRAAAPI